MKTLILLLASGLLAIGAVSCNGVSNTSADAPANTEGSAASPDSQTAQKNLGDATSDVRKAQIESDIRAREQRSNVTGGDTDRADGDLQSEVRGKLEANLPASSLSVSAKEGVVTIAGTVQKQEQLNKIEPLAMQIKGVKSVMNKAQIASAKSN